MGADTWSFFIRLIMADKKINADLVNANGNDENVCVHESIMDI